jgi:hypothetical protein
MIPHEKRPALTDPARGLSPVERRIALLTSADMSSEGIAKVLGTNSMAVQAVLKRPHVQRYILSIGATYADDIRDLAKRVNKSIIDQTERAVEIVSTLMDDMFERRDEVPCAKLAFATAQDILDRAGASAPKRVTVDEDHRHGIDVEQFHELISVLKEMKNEQAA